MITRSTSGAGRLWVPPSGWPRISRRPALPVPRVGRPRDRGVPGDWGGGVRARHRDGRGHPRGPRGDDRACTPWTCAASPRYARLFGAAPPNPFPHLADITADRTAGDAFTAAVEAVSAAGYTDQFLKGAVEDYEKLLRLDLGATRRQGSRSTPRPTGRSGRSGRRSPCDDAEPPPDRGLVSSGDPRGPPPRALRPEIAGTPIGASGFLAGSETGT